MTHVRILVVCLAAWTVHATSACGHTGSSDETSSVPTRPRHLSDGEVIGVLLAVNQCEVHQAELASTRAASPEVQSYAARMIAEHGSASRQVEDVAARHELTSEPSSLATTEQQEGDALADRLSTLSGNEFDRTYVANQITVHRDVIHIIDETLLPSVDEPELAALLPVLRATIADHLEHAERLEAALDEPDTVPSSSRGMRRHDHTKAAPF